MSVDRGTAVKKAEELVREGKIELAIAEYLRLVEDQPGDVSAANALGDLYAKVGNRAAAVAQFTRIGDSHRDSGFIPKAVAFYKKALKVDPGSDQALSQLATIAVGQELYADATLYLNRLLQRRRDLNNEAGVAECLVRLGGFPSATADAKLAAAKAAGTHFAADQTARLWIAAADALERAGRTPETVDVLIQAAALDRENEALRRRALERVIEAAPGRRVEAEALLGPLVETVTPVEAPEPEPMPEPALDAAPEPEAIPEPEPIPEPAVMAEPEAVEVLVADATVEDVEVVDVAIEAVHVAEPLPELEPESEPEPEPAPEPEPMPEPALDAAPEPEATPEPEPIPEPQPELQQLPEPDSVPEPEPAPLPEPEPVPAPEPTPAPVMSQTDEDSIAAFRTAAQNPALQFQASAQLGRLLLRLGRPGEGIEWLEKAAQAPTSVREQRLDVLYELADALERSGQPARALDVFADLDFDAASYRDVPQRMAALRRELGEGSTA